MAKKKRHPSHPPSLVGSYDKNATPPRTTVTVSTFRGEHLHLQSSRANEADAAVFGPALLLMNSTTLCFWRRKKPESAATGEL